MAKRQPEEAPSGPRAAIYTRISQDQTGEQLGVTRQQEDCEDLAKSLGWEVVEVYVENDTSAYKKRPQYERMLADVDAGHINAIIAWHADRLYRRAVDLGPLVDVCKRTNTQIATVRSSTIDLTTPTGRLVAGLLAQVATYEGEAKSDRWKRSVRQRREAGAMPGSGPRMKGWTRDGEIVPEEADEIRWLAQQVLDGASLNTLSRGARDRGIRSTMADQTCPACGGRLDVTDAVCPKVKCKAELPPLTGNVMSNQAVKRLLLNPRVAGYSTLNGEIVGKGDWPSILDTDEWETIRSMLTVRGSRPTPARVASLAGLIWCGGCGTRMVSGSRTKKRGGLSRTYRCSRTTEGGGCSKVSMNAELVEQVVEAYARERLENPVVREHIDRLRAVPKAELAELTGLQERLIELEHQLDEPGVPVAAIIKAMDRTKERIEALSAIIARAPSQPLPAFGAPWPEDVQRRRALIGLVVEQVVVQPAPRPGVVDLERIEITPR